MRLHYVLSKVLFFYASCKVCLGSQSGVTVKKQLRLKYKFNKKKNLHLIKIQVCVWMHGIPNRKKNVVIINKRREKW